MHFSIKTLFFVLCPFCTTHSICHNIDFWQGSFVWKSCILNLTTCNYKKVFQFFKEVFVFRKFIPKLKYWNCSKFPVIFTKTYQSLKWRTTLKIPKNILGERMLFLLALKLNLYKKRCSYVKIKIAQKPTQILWQNMKPSYANWRHTLSY